MQKGSTGLTFRFFWEYRPDVCHIRNTFHIITLKVKSECKIYRQKEKKKTKYKWREGNTGVNMMMYRRPDRKTLPGLYLIFRTAINKERRNIILSELQYCFQGSFRCLIGRSGLHSIADYIYFFAKSAYGFFQRIAGPYSQSQHNGIVAA